MRVRVMMCYSAALHLVYQVQYHPSLKTTESTPIHIIYCYHYNIITTNYNYYPLYYIIGHHLHYFIYYIILIIIIISHHHHFIMANYT